MSLMSELKRRSVFKAGAAYLVVAWLVIQVAATVAPQMGLPDWAPRLVTLILMVGFPVALLLIRLGAPELAEDRIIALWDARYDIMMNVLWNGALDPIRCRPRFKAMVASFPVPDPRAAEVCGGAVARPN